MKLRLGENREEKARGAKKENEDMKEDFRVYKKLVLYTVKPHFLLSGKRDKVTVNCVNNAAADLIRDGSKQEEESQGNTRHKVLKQPKECNVNLPRGCLYLSTVLSTHTHTHTHTHTR